MALPPFASGFQPFLRNNSDTLLAAGAGLLGGQTAPQQVAGLAQGVAGARQKNKTLEFLRQQNPDLAAAVESGALSGGDAYKLFYQQKLEAEKPKNNYLTVGKNIYDLDNKQWISPPAGVGGNDDNYFGTVIKGYDEQGNPIYLQPGKDGTPNQIKLPEGFKPENKFDKIDLGDSWMIKDNTNGSSQIVPKNIANENQQKAVGTAAGQAQAALPQVEGAADQLLSSIDSLATDPYLPEMVGPVSGKWLPNVTADANRVQSKMDQIGGQSFLQAFNMLKGSGQITEIEGQKATQAIARLNTAQSYQDYSAALNELKQIAVTAKTRARQQAGQGGQSPAAAPGATSSGVTWSVEP
ncbi:hypothetical protein HLI01_22180 [Rhizobium laguerreae]|uniref:hypothetical protein n=1 Tax=Rhizobium laguerreae TaxID=1076926 RepID=UPI00147898F5|nr:hypothetical protein [Rhizobium laguerreae]NNH59446.1 hypothetical protein [Rhizobium laguerreae]